MLKGLQSFAYNDLTVRMQTLNIEIDISSPIQIMDQKIKMWERKNKIIMRKKDENIYIN